MNSRMNKYYDGSTGNNQRSHRNKDLYQDIRITEPEDFKIDSNVAVLGSNPREIDIEEIKQLIDTKYQTEPKRKSIPISLEEDITFEEDAQETRDYDINTILQKARSEKNNDYEIDRLKKLRNTQYNILKNLDLEAKETNDVEKEKLLELINTITHKELIKEKNVDPLDILTDLKGEEHTQVMEPVNMQNTMDVQTIKEVVQEEVQSQIDRSFYTNSSSFTQSDFDDFNDLKEDVKSSKILIQILIILILIILAAGIVVLLNTFLNLGWF